MGYQKYSNAYNNTTNGKNIRYQGGGGDNTTGGAYYSPSYIKSPYDLDIDRRRGLGGGNSTGGGNTSGGGYTGGGMKEDLARKFIKQIGKKQNELRAEYLASNGSNENIRKKMQWV